MSFRALAAALVAVTLLSTSAFAHSVTVGSLSLTDLWTRATPAGAPTAAGYLTITNNGAEADKLIAASSPAAASGELHLMTVKDGVMSMNPVEGGIEILPGKSVTLAPGGFHIMFVTLKDPLKEGGKLPVMLTFEKAGKIETFLHIKAIGADGPGDMGAMKHEGRSNMPMLKAIQYVVWAAVVVLGGAIIWSVVAEKLPNGSGVIASASIGGPFRLVDQKGAPVTEAALQGHPSALFFGYTFCPDVCPTTLADMTIWLKDLGPGGDKLKAYFITVDPERDTQAAMASYLEFFDPRITGLTGTRPEIDQIIKAYRVYSRKVEGTDGAPYTMDHTASVYLLDEKAQFVGTVDYQEKPENALAKLKRLVGA